MDYQHPQGAYVRLTDHEGSPAHAHAGSATRGFFFPNRQYASRPSDHTLGDSEDDDPALHSSGGAGRRRASGRVASQGAPNGGTTSRESSSWWKRMVAPRKPPPEEPQSDYLTLIPLSDSRLKPQRTRLIVGSLLVLAFMAVSAVYVLVPRGVTVGTIQVHSSQISFNTSKSTYQILLTATIPVYNPNYLSVTLSGTINVSFYDQQAGYTPLHPVQVAALAQPQVITLGMDASSVPQKYLFTIYTQCFTFPEKLIFFLTGSLQAVHLFQVIKLPLIDNYFIIACNQSPDSKDNVSAPALPQPSALLELRRSSSGTSLGEGQPP